MLDGDLTCDLCRSDESLDMIKEGGVCWNCSRPLPQSDVNYDTPDSQKGSPARTPLSSFQYLSVCSTPSPYTSLSPGQLPRDFYVPPEQFSTKLHAIVENLNSSAHGSKRLVANTSPLTLD